MDELFVSFSNGSHPNSLTITQLFRQQCQLVPCNIAITYSNEQLTYQNLDWLSNKLASYLIEFGVKAHDLVGIYLDRSITIVVAILAVLKVGAGYLPLDKKYPKERLNYLINDSKVDKVITLSDFSDELHGLLIKPVFVDFIWEQALDIKKTEFDLVSVDIDSVAYVNYTSGSTGAPKGVVIPHRGVISLVVQQKALQLDSSIVTLQLAPISFDAFTFELWGALLNGGRCVLFPYPLPTVNWLKEIIQINQVNAAFITASLFNVLVDEEPTLFSTMKYVLIGGEALSAAHVYKAYQSLPDTQLKNMYGPTECTTFSIGYNIEYIDKNAKTVPIGKPISNVLVYILDKCMYPVPVGVVGEIYIGGQGLALGYLNRPELTQERFIQTPNTLKTKERLYKTGDLGYFLPDGDIEYVGRVDNQIKLHGFRIELDEIDSVLKQHPGVKNSVSIIQYDQALQKKLFSYVILDQNIKTTRSQIMQYLKRKLPYFMIPNVIYETKSLPLNENGKLDRVALQDQLLCEEMSSS